MNGCGEPVTEMFSGMLHDVQTQSGDNQFENVTWGTEFNRGHVLTKTNHHVKYEGSVTIISQNTQNNKRTPFCI